MSQSFYIIKPEAFQFCSDIREIIISARLNIISFKATFIPHKVIEALYSDCSQKIIEATKFYVCNKLCEVGIVSGNNAVNKLLEVCGLDPNPNNCAEGSIRYTYGIKQASNYEGIFYFKNAIHRPITTFEMEKNISYIQLMLSSSII